MTGEGRVQRESGALEAEVMTVLWQANAPMAAGQVHEAIGDAELSYKTVLTVLARLHAKGQLERERAGRAHAYAPCQDAAAAAAEKMTAALTGIGDRTAVLQRFVDALDPDAEAALRALLDARD
ncbi:BlaI/MecI/CopY family transcriptional regulator [Kitasatospora sp. RB6PN24]|uniref:BlaI/MecI/CopY family transcriptional regulator n=1 Tax=Kitasatospora humi TaxID=2893891 RepID=UPI001E55B20A|nr:BlaI/MecI/CopY family transcriptional regulator [Kitasatospora humi]MCC9311579.1 BlaI/MecI/CopY family transcriptional regulator [Kitasatospora humi]